MEKLKKSIKLSPFAMANLKSMTSAQVQAVKEAIDLLQAGGIHTRLLETHRLPSKQAYVVNTGSGTRLTVMHEGGGHLLVDDVFVKTSPADIGASSASLTEHKTALSRPDSVGPKVVKPTIAIASREQDANAAHKTSSAKKSVVKKAAAAKLT